MKKLNLFCLSLVALGWACAAHAELKMGYVNAARLLEEAPQAEQSMNRLKKEFSPREEKIVSSQKTITDREDQLRLNSAVMTEEARRKMERDVVADKRD
ncbi:MAG: outer membrane protein, partial [Halothiobacillaceae bacterium]